MNVYLSDRQICIYFCIYDRIFNVPSLAQFELSGRLFAVRTLLPSNYVENRPLIHLLLAFLAKLETFRVYCLPLSRNGIHAFIRYVRYF